MTQINTTYENLGPIVKELRHLNTNAFFQLPDDGTVYRLLGRRGSECTYLNLDDLTAAVLVDTTVVEPVEIDRIEVKVEVL
ncbi:hypothetical protein CRX22_10690 [Salmonella enterica subsp. enterica serovar Newport]|nr:hypothetical protein [Salmonella enterica subsp. enterica serovar Newport]